MNLKDVKPRCELCKEARNVLINGLCNTCGKKLYDRYLQEGRI